MTKIIKTAFVLLIGAFLFTGCHHRYNPSPEDTILGINRECRPDWIDDEGFCRKQGLEVRRAPGNLSQYAHNVPDVSVFFAFDQANLTSKERQKLQDAAYVLKENPSSNLLLVGRCDWHGTEEYNIALGDRRARTVQSYLQELGMDSSKMTTLSRGSLDAAPTGSSNQVWQDRRVDIIVIR